MGLAKKIAIISGCTIGGIIAAPAVATIASSTLICTGAGAALSAAEAILFASSTAIGAAGAATGAIAGTTATVIQDKKDKTYKEDISKARNDGYKSAAKIFNDKYKKDMDDFINKEKSFEKNTAEYMTLINEMKKYIRALEEELDHASADRDELEKQIAKLKQKEQELENLKK